MLTVFALAASACSRTPPERQAVVDAADAMGGRQKVLDVKTLTVEGEGAAPNVGQNTMPDGELPVWKVTEFKRTVDLPNHRMRMQQFRTAQFLFANANTQRQDQGLDGDVAFNIGADGTATRAAQPQVMADRRMEMLAPPATSSSARRWTIPGDEVERIPDGGRTGDRRDRNGEGRAHHAGD